MHLSHVLLATAYHLHSPILASVEAVGTFQLNVSNVEECQMTLWAANVVQNVLLVAVAAFRFPK